MKPGAPELSRPVRIDTLGVTPREMTIDAAGAEREALAERFGLVAIDRLEAELSLVRDGDTVTATGSLQAAVTQSCVASGEPVTATIDVKFQIHFGPEPEGRPGSDEGIELSEAECDIVFYEGPAIDVGEAIAETLALNLDPWPRAPDADEALREAGIKREEEVGPFASLAGLKDRLKKG